MISKDQFMNNKLEEAESFYNNQVIIQREWEEFTQTGNHSVLHSVRPEIKESWIRSYEYGINPYEKPTEKLGYRLTQEQLALRLENNKTILDIISPLLDILVGNLGPQFRIDYYDRDLFLIKSFFGSSEALYINPYAVPGVNRSEKYTGTNAPALSHILNIPCQLTGYEHYLKSSHSVTCAAMPIHLPDRRIQGYLNAYGPYDIVHYHTLCMVITLSQVIEQSIKLHYLYIDKDVALQYINHLMDSISDGVIALESDGKISMMNPTARKILGIPTKQENDSPSDFMLNPDSSIMETLASGSSLIDKELWLSYGKRKISVFGNSLSIRYSDNNKGALSVFKEINSAKKFAHNIVGFKAYYTFDDLIGIDEKFTQIITIAKRIANLDPHVLISGESGTGKELIAQSIHNASTYFNGPFVAINCAAIPSNLIESELFGYEGGAFTGGKKEGQIGKLALAENGTLFLDEIDSLSITNQATLLRVIQNKTYTRVGGTKELRFNARLIVASNQDLQAAVESGRFRQDLFYRINVINLALPPLRERKSDIRILSQYFLDHCSKRMNYEFRINDDVVEKFMAYQWPGNVRELENIIERCAVAAYSQMKNSIDIDILSISAPLILNSNTIRANENGLNYFPDNYKRLLNEAVQGPNGNQKNNLASLEKQYIESVLKETRYNLYQSAKKLGIARTTLYAKINKYQIAVNDKEQ